MTSRYKQNVAASKARLDAELRAFARAVGHHGPDTLIEAVRQRMNVALDPAYARELCALAGWKEAAR